MSTTRKLALEIFIQIPEISSSLYIYIFFFHGLWIFPSTTWPEDKGGPCCWRGSNLVFLWRFIVCLYVLSVSVRCRRLGGRHWSLLPLPTFAVLLLLLLLLLLLMMMLMMRLLLFLGLVRSAAFDVALLVPVLYNNYSISCFTVWITCCFLYWNVDNRTSHTWFWLWTVLPHPPSFLDPLHTFAGGCHVGSGLSVLLLSM